MKVRFQKTIILTTDLNYFYKTMGWTLGGFGAALGCLLAYEGDFGSIFVSLLGHMGHIDVEWQA